MSWYLSKSFIVFCILLIVNCISSEEAVMPVESIETIVSDVLNANAELITEIIPSVSVEVEVGSGDSLTTMLTIEEDEEETTPIGADEDATTARNCLDDCVTDSTSKCVCDCNTGALLGALEGKQCGVATEEETTTITLPVNEPITTVTPPVPQPRNCETLGAIRPNEQKCQSYFVCHATAEGLVEVEENCPLGTAFNVLLRRCARDLAACKEDEPPCLSSGTFADGHSNSSYMWCVPSLSDDTMHKYRVRCASYEIFLPALGTCFIDMDKITNNVEHIYELRDIDVIKAELVEFKMIEKAQLKEQKLKLKFEKKLQKALIKKAIKEAKERAKLEGKDSQETEKFVCTQEGNFKSVLGDNFYNSCISKKGKLKAVIMLCAAGSIFDELSGTCL